MKFFEKQDLLSYEDKEVAAILMIHEIRGYGSNTLNVFSGNTHYENILAKNHEKIAARSKLTVPKVASVRFREKSIADMLMQEALNELSAEEIQGALIGAHIQPTKENTKEILKKAVAAAGVQGVSTLVGKKALKELVLDILKNYLTKQLGKKASKMVVKKIASKVAQKTFKSALGWLGVALIAKDVYDFAGEASRVTMPFVINISIYRSIENPD